jgi:hypothetical protein
VIAVALSFLRQENKNSMNKKDSLLQKDAIIAELQLKIAKNKKEADINLKTIQFL